MKKIVCIVLSCIAFMLLSCEQNAPAFKKVITGEATNITDYSAQLHGTLNVDPDSYGHLYYGIVIAKTQEEIQNQNGKFYESTELTDKEYLVNVFGLTPNTQYYYCTWVGLNQNVQKYFGKVKTFTTLDGTGMPEGEKHPNTNYTAHPFSVGNKSQVYFSPGNLQYRPNATTWRFAHQQTDYIGSDNRNTALTYDSWIDLFGWSTHEGHSYFGVGIDTADNYYQGRFQDWGCKRIGIDEPNTWRTLTLDEWRYLLKGRKNNSALMACAVVMGVNGLILLPDDWQCPEGVTFKPGFYESEDKAGYGAHLNIYEEQWILMERAGAVFLPAAGFREGLDVGNYQQDGFYWSATANKENTAYYVFFSAGLVQDRIIERYHGLSVRLVRDVKH